MPHKFLESELVAVDWNVNVGEFLGEAEPKIRISAANLRLAIWAKQFEKVDLGNPALCFIREMQIAGHHVAVASALCLYKCAASSVRNIVETALYYTYFRSHFKELETLVRDPRFFVSKEDIIEYHKKHSLNFAKYQDKLGLVGRLNLWYSEISAVVHGQVPGTWNEFKSISEISHNSGTLDLVVNAFCQGEEIVNQLFLCTTGKEFWDVFSTTSKKKLIHGLPGEIKTLLAIDAA